MKEKFRKFAAGLIAWLRYPHGWGLLLIWLLFAAVLAVTVFLIVSSPVGAGFEVLSYVFYALSAVLLGFCVYSSVVFLRTVCGVLVQNNKLASKIKNEYEFRTILFSVLSLMIAFGIAAYYAVLFGLSLSVWYGALTIYFFVLALARGGILLSRRIGVKRGESKLLLQRRDAKNYLACGVLLVLLALAFSGVIVLIVLHNFHYDYFGFTIYVAAAYAFWKISFAIVNLIRAQKREDLTVRALRNINLSDALVSIVALQAAMLQVFSDDAQTLNFQTFNAITGGISGAIILAIGFSMIIRGCRRLNE